MEIPAIAQWINETFANFDLSVFSWVQQTFHATSLESLWNVIFTAFTTTCNGGLIMIFLSLALMFFKKTRKVGSAMLLGIIIGSIFTNVALKPLIGRPRPYTHTDMPFYQWWVSAGSHLESEKSFPSGHMTCAMSSMTGLFFTTNKKIGWLGFIFALIVGLSRIFFFVHYPSDVVAGLITGFIAGLISGIVINYVYKKYYDKSTLNYTNFDILKKIKH